MSVINLKGRKPQTILPGEVYCGRPQNMGGWRLKGSKFANPFKVGRDGTIEEVLEKYREYVTSTPALMDALDELRNKNLACWCAPAGCHCDVLLELLAEPKGESGYQDDVVEEPEAEAEEEAEEETLDDAIGFEAAYDSEEEPIFEGYD